MYKPKIIHILYMSVMASIITYGFVRTTPGSEYVQPKAAGDAVHFGPVPRNDTVDINASPEVYFIRSTKSHFKSRQEVTDNAIRILHTGRLSNQLITQCNKLPPNMTCFVSTKFSAHTDYDAVVVHMREIRNVQQNTGWTFSKRTPLQTVIFYEHEPPTKTWSYLNHVDPSSFRHKFNLTSTFSLDSDIPFSNWQCTVNRSRHEELAGINFAENKTRNVAWFISHCDTSSKREVYARELAKYIDVDIYGACGPLTCANRSASADIKRMCEKQVLSQTYRFYLAFENSFCANYITEKITNVMKYDIDVIPVVMGYANYSARLPPSTVIDVRDFASPKHLAQFLKTISEEDDRFNEYIRKRKSLTCSGFADEKYCEICQYLHEQRHRKHVVDDVASFWSVKKQCISNEQYWQGRMP